MSRRNIAKKRYPKPDPNFKSSLVSLLNARILKNGKKQLATKIIIETFAIVEEKTKTPALEVFEKAIKNTTPLVEVKARRIGGSTYQVPLEVNRYRGTTLALRWLIKASVDRSGRTMSFKLANEIMDAANSIGNAVRKREETHRMAEANKAFAHFRY
uniref:Small ribosomal subunit protein uS7c n=1 Tax=Rhizochromulina marina TaxID=1034831 RepID=A0A514CPT1_9STRA|nr:ribosomal protein S7 [Rhizochromulina marina]QDH81816.1 ribosomal protein S7 [Rhizochromulina marina]